MNQSVIHAWLAVALFGASTPLADEHHWHVHASGSEAGGPHEHRRKHRVLMHKHPHLPDIHHRHSH